jgi:hypothetical protein
MASPDTEPGVASQSQTGGQSCDNQAQPNSVNPLRKAYSVPQELRSKREAADARRAAAPNISKAELQPGDVLMFRLSRHSPHSITNIGHAGLIGAQTHLLRRQPQDHHLADIKLTHSAMYVKSQEGDPEIVEAVFPHIQAYDLPAGEHVVYRYKNPQIAEKAAEITKTWVSGDPISYPFKKVAAASSTIVKHGAEFTPQSLEAVEAMANQAETPRPEWAAEGAFCSELTTAAYQAAAQLNHRETMDKGIPTAFDPVIARETRLTTPATLVHAMEDNPNFELVGKLVERSKLRQWTQQLFNRSGDG